MMTPADIDRAYRSETTDQLRVQLQDFLDAEQFGMWLALPQQLLGGISALEAIHLGRGAEALRLAQQLEPGAYLA